MSTIRVLASSVLLLAMSAMNACSAPSQNDASTSDATDLIAHDTPVESGRMCATDTDCSDGIFCNGAERCMPGAVGADTRGCLAASTANPCIAGQSCEEASMRCLSNCSHAPDADGDGHRSVDCGGDDCADDDPNRFPGNSEVCDANSHDEDCDPRTFGYRDVDMDMYVDHQCCNTDTTGHMNCGDDCDDSRANMHPALAEVCDGLDNNCNMAIDEGVTRTFHVDMDHDGYSDGASASMPGCNPPDGYAEPTGDCNDMRSDVHPGALEVCDAMMVDENCDGVANPTTLCACAGDVTRMCVSMGVCSAGTERCVNGSWGLCSIGPTPETCNGLDDNCDGTVDEGLSVTCYPDGDNDGYAPAGATAAHVCPVPGRDAFAGCPPNQTNRTPFGIDIDCNDSDSTVSPGQTELCDPAMRDENCDGVSNPPTLCACVDGQTRPCTAPGSCGAGNQTCSGGHFSACSVNPVAESCNGIDDNCNGTVDEGLTVTCYADNDNDGYASAGRVAIQSCPVMGRDGVGGCPTNQTNRAPSGSNIDCNDANSAISPGAVEQCDAAMVDENCDGMANPAALCACSGTASRSCPLPGACAAGTQACSSGSWGTCSISPLAEVCNGIDDNCNGTVDEMLTVLCYVDADNDGYAATGAMTRQSCPVSGREAVGGCPTNQTNRAPSGTSIDCNDTDASVSPGAVEVCDAAMRDENCDGVANPPAQCVCSGSGTRACTLSGACAAGTQQCMSGSWGSCSIVPIAESCNGIDDNCNGTVDEGLTVTCYPDGDGDGYALMGATSVQSCPVTGRGAVGGCPTNQTNRVPTAGNADCNDTDSTVNPGAIEVCDAAMRDENCDGVANPPALCACSGTASRACPQPGACAAGTQTCSSGNWGPCSISPVAESCNGVDDNCNGVIDEALKVNCYLDLDNDGYPAAGAITSSQCIVAGRDPVGGCPVGYTNRASGMGSDDCADNNSARSPAAIEVCNGADDNCNGMIDEGVQTTFYRDADADGYGSSSSTTLACSLPAGYSAFGGDCNDANLNVRPGAVELCNGIDDNCNAMTDEAPATAQCAGANPLAIHVGSWSCSGSCSVGTCAAGWGDCDGSPVNGCETNLTSDSLHCGSCAVACGPGALCTTSTCDTITDLTAGAGTTCVTWSSGRVVCWGSGGSGELNSPALADSALPRVLPDVAGVSLIGLSHSDLSTGQICAGTAASGGPISCWGRNGTYQVGDGSVLTRYVPQVIVPNTGAGATSAFGLGRQHSCAAWTNSVSCWGANYYGELGYAPPASPPGYVTMPPAFGANGYLGNGNDVAAGSYFTCVRLLSGDVRCIGSDNYGKLGDGAPYGGVANNRSNLGTQIATTTSAIDVEVADEHGCATRSVAPTLVCWGRNGFGELGDGTGNTAPAPVTVPVPAGATSWVQVALGTNHTCGRTNTNRVYCWGANGLGELGTDTAGASRATPTLVTSLTGVTDIASGNDHTCAVVGTHVYCWGYNASGQLGTGTADSSAHPIPALVSGF